MKCLFSFKSLFRFSFSVIAVLCAVCESAIAQTTYQGAMSTSSDTWNIPGNWTGLSVPSGIVDVVISAAAPYATVWNNSTPTNAGNVTLEANTTIQVGWTTDYQNSWRALGTAGSTLLTMGDGAYIKGRTSGALAVPAIHLLGDAILSLGESTQTPADPTFNYPITGAHTFTLRSNFTSTPEFNVSNSFNHLVIEAQGSRGGSPGNIGGNVQGAFGEGDVTVIPYVNAGVSKCSTLEFDAAGVMSSTGTLYLSGGGPAGDGANLIQMDANNTIGGLVINGYTYPAGNYDSTRGSWITGSFALTVTGPTNDTTAPVLSSIDDDVSGGPLSQTNYVVNFTVNFVDFLMDGASIDASDFTNAGSASVAIGTLSQLSETNFSLPVYIDSAGTIQLEIIQGTVIQDMAGNSLDTTSAITDDAIITVSPYVSPAISAAGTVTVYATNSTSLNSQPLILTLDASAADKLVVVVTGEHGFGGNTSGDCLGVTYDGATLTQAVNRTPVTNAPSAAFDQTFNDIWYLDNPGSVHVSGQIVATLNGRGSISAFALTGTAPGVGATAISPQEYKYVKLGTVYKKSIVIASHGMGGDGNTANTDQVNTVPPLIEATAIWAGTKYDGHVTGYMQVDTPGVVVPTFIGGNIVGTHTIAAEFGCPPPAGTVILFR